MPFARGALFDEDRSAYAQMEEKGRWLLFHRNQRPFSMLAIRDL